MIIHYMKVALRNLLKYKIQTAISMLGLAVGFVCFALSAFWIEHESTYDAHRKDAHRIYVIQSNAPFRDGKKTNRIPYSFGEYLKAQYPEVENMYIGDITQRYINFHDGTEKANFSSADSLWIDFLGVKVIKGNRNFQTLYTKEIAISEEKARKWFGHTDPIGKTIKCNGQKYTICAIVQVENEHTNFPIDIVGYDGSSRDWTNSYYYALAKLKPETDMQEMETKINAHLPSELKVDKRNVSTGIQQIYLKPLTELRHDRDFQNDQGIAYNYILYFSITGLLIIFCAIVNYLSLFINRMRIRQREMALRLVHGSSYTSLVALLISEFLVMLGCAVFFGFMMIEIFLPPFRALTGTQASKMTVFTESFLYIGLVSLIMVSVIILLLYILLHRSLHGSMHSTSGTRTELWLRKGSLTFQLFISLTFISSTLLMNRQLDYLRYRDMGMNIENIGVFSMYGQYLDREAWQKKIESMPMVTEVLPPHYQAIITQKSFAVDRWRHWEGLDTPLENFIPVNIFIGDEKLFNFYGITLLAGEHLNEFSEAHHIIINESLARQMGWTPEEAINKRILKNNKPTFLITGVIKDCHYIAPTLPTPPMGFVAYDSSGWADHNHGVLFKYKPGTWEKCKNELLTYYQSESLQDSSLTLSSEEDTYNIYLHSENLLTRLLSFASIICVLTAIFGIYSLVTLTCEQRRKEIAIRKVNGAKVTDILMMFFREYMAMLALAALVAFPLTYAIIKYWIENYTRQMEITLWPFTGVFMVLLMIVIFCIYYRVWEAANENPADVVKSE